MNDVSLDQGFFGHAWRYALVLAGEAFAASGLLDAAIEDVKRRGDHEDARRLRMLLFLAVRKRGIALARVSRPDPAVARFHGLAEPGRTALVLLYLDVFSSEEIGRMLDEDEATVAESLERARAELALPATGESK